jgi:hypothetical protein
MANKIQLRRDTATNWTAANPVLSAGEVGVDLTNKKIKIGDGATRWNSLEYWDDKEPNGFDGTYTSLTGKPSFSSIIGGDRVVADLPPANSTGVEGDRNGMIAVGGGYLYVCTADWVSPGSANIWTRTTLTTGAW